MAGLSRNTVHHILTFQVTLTLPPPPILMPGMKQQYFRHRTASVCEKHFVPPQ